MAPMKVLLATLHSKYIHASLALPYLAASIHGMSGIETVVREYTVNESLSQIMRGIMDEEADVVAFSCYIWNIEFVERIASDLKKLRPHTAIIVGGPEVSHTANEVLEKNGAFDMVIRGEGETTWRELVRHLRNEGSLQERHPGIPAGLVFRNGDTICATPARESIHDLDEIPSPFALGLADLRKPLVYYETSRGCPFSCAFCLSSLDQGVRSFSLERIRSDLRILMDRNVAVIKFVDRTFNYDESRAEEIWDFILTRNKKSKFHFEIAADLLTGRNLETLRKVPPGMFRFEIGVQATARETLERVGRNSDTKRLLETSRRLAAETGVTVHLDLVAGLPGEDAEGFLRSLQRLFLVSPHHIQVEPLKILKGSPMSEIAKRERYLFSSTPPYQILTTPDLSFGEIGRIEDIARLLDLYYNSNRFVRSLSEIGLSIPLSVFFSEMSNYMRKQPETGHPSLAALFTLLWRFVEKVIPSGNSEIVRDALCYDFCLVEYPSTGVSPPFFNLAKRNARSLPKNRIDEFVSTLTLPSGSRVRVFAADFMKDHTHSHIHASPITIVFVYLSVPGSGLKITAIPLEKLESYRAEPS